MHGLNQFGRKLIREGEFSPQPGYVAVQPLDIRDPAAQHNHLRIQDRDHHGQGFRHAALVSRHAGFCHIIALGGQAAITGRPGTAAVTTAKTGLLGLIRAIAAEMAPHNIRANLVNPGSTDTERRHPGWYPEFRDVSRGSPEHLKALPMGRQGTVQDIANACLFFASDESAYVTGDRLNVVGGRYIV